MKNLTRIFRRWSSKLGTRIHRLIHIHLTTNCSIRTKITTKEIQNSTHPTHTLPYSLRETYSPHPAALSLFHIDRITKRTRINPIPASPHTLPWTGRVTKTNNYAFPASPSYHTMGPESKEKNTNQLCIPRIPRIPFISHQELSSLKVDKK